MSWRALGVRVAGIAAVVVLATACAWLLFHLLRPELFRGDAGGIAGSLPHYLERALLHFDFGTSLQGRRAPVADLIRDGLPADVSLLAGGLAFGFLGGTGAAILCARRPRGIASRAAQSLAMVAVCAPVYVVGLMVLLFLGRDISGVNLVPLDYVSFGDSPTGWLGALIAPWIVLGLPLAGLCLRTMLGQMVELGEEEYVQTARAKGLPEWTVLRRHVAPTALAPTAMFASASMPLLLTNIVLVERVYSVPGVFATLTQSIGTANTPLILGMTTVGALLIAVTTFVFDVVLARLDPRVRAG